MELEKVTPGGALVKRTDKQDKLAVGVGAAGLAIMALPFFAGLHFLALAAGIGAIFLSWESVTARDRRTALATAAFVMGSIPVAFEIFGLVGWIFKLLIIGGIVGGIYLGGRAIRNKKKKDAAPELEPEYVDGSARTRVERPGRPRDV